MTKAAYAPHELTAAQLQPLRDAVLVTEMIFDQRITQSGLILPSDNGTSLGIRPRWGQVYAVGPDQKDVTVGQWICVAHGRWTRGLEINDNGTDRTLRRIDPKDILLVADHQPQDDTMSTAVHIAKQ
jgi:co-chaperonin GroES (HSP10)